MTLKWPKMTPKAQKRAKYARKVSVTSNNPQKGTSASLGPKKNCLKKFYFLKKFLGPFLGSPGVFGVLYFSKHVLDHIYAQKNYLGPGPKILGPIFEKKNFRQVLGQKGLLAAAQMVLGKIFFWRMFIDS